MQDYQLIYIMKNIPPHCAMKVLLARYTLERICSDPIDAVCINATVARTGVLVACRCGWGSVSIFKSQAPKFHWSKKLRIKMLNSLLDFSKNHGIENPFLKQWIPWNPSNQCQWSRWAQSEQLPKRMGKYVGNRLLIGLNNGCSDCHNA